MRRGHLDVQRLTAPLQAAITDIDAVLARDLSNADAPRIPRMASDEPLALPDPFGTEVPPWLLRRLALSTDLAVRLAADARRVIQ